MSSKINLQPCEYARKSSIFQDNQLIFIKCALECEKTSKDYALTGGTLFTMTLLRDNVKRWRKSCIEGEKWFYPIVIDGSPTFLKKRADEYMMRWGDEVEE